MLSWSNRLRGSIASRRSNMMPLPTIVHCLLNGDAPTRLFSRQGFVRERQKRLPFLLSIPNDILGRSLGGHPDLTRPFQFAIHTNFNQGFQALIQDSFAAYPALGRITGKAIFGPSTRSSKSVSSNSSMKRGQAPLTKRACPPPRIRRNEKAHGDYFLI
jgi:hypothetical protein